MKYLILSIVLMTGVVFSAEKPFTASAGDKDAWDNVMHNVFIKSLYYGDQGVNGKMHAVSAKTEGPASLAEIEKNQLSAKMSGTFAALSLQRTPTTGK